MSGDLRIVADGGAHLVLEGAIAVPRPLIGVKSAQLHAALAGAAAVFVDVDGPERVGRIDDASWSADDQAWVTAELDKRHRYMARLLQLIERKGLVGEALAAAKRSILALRPGPTYRLTEPARDLIARHEAAGLSIPARTKAMLLESEQAELWAIAAEARRGVIAARNERWG